MPDKNLNRFFVSIVLPSILAIGFFILSIFVVILPSVEKNIMAGKKEMIAELTNTAWSLMEEYHQEVQEGKLTKDTARHLAATKIERIRYGDEYKDYFWIINEKPEMIMHPYRPELINTDLNYYKDPDGKRLFVEAANIVDEKGEGFINYMWQWKDDSTRIVPKLSFVKGFKPWGWIVGTGIYLEDVRQEISILKNKLLRVALLITLIICIILAFIIKQSLSIENKRKNAEKKLRLSRQKYKSLVEASTEGTMMILKTEIIFSNFKFSEISGYDPFEIRKKKFNELFDLKWNELENSFKDPKKSINLETTINRKDGSSIEVILSASMISYTDDKGYIIIVKEVSPQKQLEKDSEKLSEELQTSLLLMNQAIKPFVSKLKKCPAKTSIKEASGIMTRKNINVLFVEQDGEIIGVINSNDLKNRVLSTGLEINKPVIDIMTSPVKRIPEDALLYEVLLILKNQKISHLAVTDSSLKMKGVIGYENIINIQQNTLSYLIKEIEFAEDVKEIANIYKRLPVIVKALIESGDKTGNINRIITSVADAIDKRVIQLAIEDLGPAPCDFAFMVMGSEGRGEQTLATDQDNAIIFADSSGEEHNTRKSYFLSLGEKVNTDLHTIGYHYCGGDIMARNPKWTASLSKWKEYFTNWINNSSPQDILEAGIFFDFRSIYGESRLVSELRDHVNKVSDNKSIFFYHMAQSVLKFKPPLNLFGRIVSENHEADELNIDIKKILFPVTTFIRLYSIKEKINNTNSLERLNELFHRESIDKQSFEELKQAFNFIMNIRLRFQVESITQNELPGNIVNLNKLSRIEVTTLKKFFSEISELQSRVGFDFKTVE